MPQRSFPAPPLRRERDDDPAFRLELGRWLTWHAIGVEPFREFAPGTISLDSHQCLCARLLVGHEDVALAPAGGLSGDAGAVEHDHFGAGLGEQERTRRADRARSDHNDPHSSPFIGDT